jgi:hypothetical protein
VDTLPGIEDTANAVSRGIDTILFAVSNAEKMDSAKLGSDAENAYDDSSGYVNEDDASSTEARSKKGCSTKKQNKRIWSMTHRRRNKKGFSSSHLAATPGTA